VLVILGNPPYDRHDRAESRDAYDSTGAWVRWGERADFEVEHQETLGILREWVEAGSEAGAGVHLKNLYNLYVYFWRWAMWKVFEDRTDDTGAVAGPPIGPGIVSFITSSSFLRGEAFVGMREALRRACDEIWIIDLGGEGRGTRKEDNVFAIQTPVCITIAFRQAAPNQERPARVRYHRMRGSRAEKLAALNALRRFRSVRGWKPCPNDWHGAMMPIGAGPYFTWPNLVDLMPWQSGGAQFKRTWPIAPNQATAQARWETLLNSRTMRADFGETRDRKVNRSYAALLGDGELRPLSELQTATAPEGYRTMAYRSFDRMTAVADARVGDYPRPTLWRAHSDRQLYISSIRSYPVGDGPAVTVAADIPDLDHFRGSAGAKHQTPLYRDAAATDLNIAPGVLDAIAEQLGHAVTGEDFAAYVYGVLAHPAFTERFWDELESCELRVPITADPALFEEAVTIGNELIWMHSYGERMVPQGQRRGRVPQGAARCARAVPSEPDSYPDYFAYDDEEQTIYIGIDRDDEGCGLIRPVPPEVWDFEVSGLHIVGSWLGYRMARRRGKRRSPLDDIHPERWTGELTAQLLELLWVLEHTLAMYPRQADLLERILDAEVMTADQLPAPLPVDHPLRKPPRTGGVQAGLFVDEDDAVNDNEADDE